MMSTVEQMMKLLVILVVAISLMGCGKVDRLEASLTGYAKTCIDGVQYLQFTSGATVQYDANGKVVTCR